MDTFETMIVSEFVKRGKADDLEASVAAACKQGWEPVSISIGDSFVPPIGFVLMRRRVA